MAEVNALIEGYKRFYNKYFASDNGLYDELARTGQNPKTLIIACSDSRVDPSIVTHAKPGDIFVIRNVANLVPPYEISEKGLHGVSAALEFAVQILEVSNIVVLGHSSCAGIAALMGSANIENTDFIGKWVSIAKRAKEKTLNAKKYNNEKDMHHECEKESIILSLENLFTFPWIKKRVEEKKLKLHGWYFELEQGHLFEYSPFKKGFQKITT
jgi:carbonic anhydrase